MLIDVDLVVISDLPECSNISKSLHNICRKDLLPNTTSLENLRDIPDRFTKSLAGENFMLTNSIVNKGAANQCHVIVFETRWNLKILSKSATWFVDGTFKVIFKSKFNQLIFIAVFIDAHYEVFRCLPSSFSSLLSWGWLKKIRKSLRTNPIHRCPFRLWILIFQRKNTVYDRNLDYFWSCIWI